MCTKATPNIGLFTIVGLEYKIPVCHVQCCDMEKEQIGDWIEHVIQPVQETFQAKLLEIKVQDLTAQLTKLRAVVEKPVRKG